MQAIDWAERDIRVNDIAPGYISNETTLALAASGYFDMSAINCRTPIGRFGTEQEVAESIIFLLAPEQASYITGHTPEVKGGWNAYGFI
jgi:NAD(P)-dependent dehydrogenase (short-subunit alcohol dehydrogenase family)